jgi:hypothetical protein
VVVPAETPFRYTVITAPSDSVLVPLMAVNTPPDVPQYVPVITGVADVEGIEVTRIAAAVGMAEHFVPSTALTVIYSPARVERLMVALQAPVFDAVAVAILVPFDKTVMEALFPEVPLIVVEAVVKLVCVMVGAVEIWLSTQMGDFADSQPFSVCVI